MSNESLIVIVAVGLVAGWLAGQITRGAGYGLVGDLIIGVIGAYIGDWLLPRLGILLGAGLVAAIIDATIGAMLLLFVFRLLAGRRRWGGGWGRRWGLPWERRANLREMNSLPAAPSQGKPIGGVAFLSAWWALRGPQIKGARSSDILRPQARDFEWSSIRGRTERQGHAHGRIYQYPH